MLKNTDLPQNNQRMMALAGASSGLGGSIALVALLVSTGLWSLWGLVTRRLSMQITRLDLYLLIPASVFVLVQVLFAFINAHDYFGDNAYLITFMGPLALYLLPWLVIPRLRDPEFDSLDRLTLGAGICAILPLPLALYQVFINQDRAAGVTGNALPFALICAVFSVLSLFNLLAQPQWRHYLGWAGFVSGILGLFLSGSIGLLPVVIPSVIIFAIMYRQTFARWINRTSLIIGGVFIVLVGIVASQWSERFVNMALFMIRPDESKKFRTFNFRLQMWDAAVDLIKARPIQGYGMQNRVALLHQKTGLDFLQFHNAFLNAWVDNGILGVVATIALLSAPMLIALKAPRDAMYGKRLFIAAFMTAIFFVGGMSYVMFMDSVYDSIFLWLAICIAVSVPVSKDNPLRFQKKSGS